MKSVKARVEAADGAFEIDLHTCVVHTEGEFGGNLDVDFSCPPGTSDAQMGAVQAHLRVRLPGADERLRPIASGEGELTFFSETLKAASPPRSVDVFWDERYVGSLLCEAKSENPTPPDKRASTPRELPPAPRRIPLSTRLRILAGRTAAQIGWFLLGVLGVPFVWVLVVNADVEALRFFLDEFESASFEELDGVILDSYETGFSEGGGKGRKGTPINAHIYSYVSPAGETVKRTAYAAGTRLEPGSPVKVQRSRSDPSLTRVRNMRNALFGPEVLLAAFVPLVGLVLVGATARTGLRSVHLLENGELAFGALRSREPTNVSVNKKPVFKLFFTFVAADGRRYEVVTKTHELEALTDEPREPVLYDPFSPEKAVMLDGLPGAPRLDERGEIAPLRLRDHGGLVLPGLAFLGHAIGTAIWLASS